MAHAGATLVRTHADNPEDARARDVTIFETVVTADSTDLRFV